MRSVLSTESAVGSATTNCPRPAPRALVNVCGALRSNVGGACPPHAESATANASTAALPMPRERRPTTLTTIPSPLPPLRSAFAAVLRHRAAAAAAAEDHPLRVAVQILDGAIEIGKGAPAVDRERFPFAQSRTGETRHPRGDVRGALVEIVGQRLERVHRLVDLALAVGAEQAFDAGDHVVDPLRVLGQGGAEGVEIADRVVQRAFALGKEIIDLAQHFARP